MKKIVVYTILLVFICTGARAQDFDLGDVMGEAQEFFGEAQDKTEHQADTEAQKRFEDAYKDKFKKREEYVNDLEGYLPETKCLYLMLKYKAGYDALTDEIQSTSDCKKKYDLYGMQLMMMMSSTTIMYCTEDLRNICIETADNIKIDPKHKSSALEALDTELIEIFNNYDDYLASSNRVENSVDDGLLSDFADLNSDLEATIIEEFFRVLHEDYRDELKSKSGDLTFVFYIASILNQYFDPISLFKNTIEISKEMDVLKPCAVRTN